MENAVQKEREQEKGEFADKDAFVTGAYRRKLQEMKEEAERERIKQEMEGEPFQIQGRRQRGVWEGCVPSKPSFCPPHAL